MNKYTMQEDHLSAVELDMGVYEDPTVGTVCESIETNLWLAEAYDRKGEDGLATECLRSAWHEYVRFSDILSVYAGDELGRRLVQALVARSGERAAELALGLETAGRIAQAV